MQLAIKDFEMTTPTPQEQRNECREFYDAFTEKNDRMPFPWQAWQAAQQPLLERLRVAEADAARYQWLLRTVGVPHGIYLCWSELNLNSQDAGGINKAIDNVIQREQK